MARILLLEDQENERLMMRLGLERSGHAVIEAGDATAARAICESAAVDLLICDIGLPDQNGKDFIAWFAEAHPGVPVVAVTGESMAQIEEPIAAAWYGAGRVVAKPFAAADLTTTVEELLRDTTSARRTDPDQQR